MPRKTARARAAHGLGAWASMRPRPDAAENRGHDAPARPADVRFNEAAARCRGKPETTTSSPSRWRGFNEAAARCRGKPQNIAVDNAIVQGASMRPRPDAAENPSRSPHDRALPVALQ